MTIPYNPDIPLEDFFEILYQKQLRVVDDAKRNILNNFDYTISHIDNFSTSPDSPKSKELNELEKFYHWYSDIDSKHSEYQSNNLVLFNIYKLSDIFENKEIKDFECDCCKEVNEFYKTTYNWLKNFECEIQAKTFAKYQLRHIEKNIIFKGDTMTSVFTPLQGYINLKYNIPSTYSRGKKWSWYCLEHISEIEISDAARAFIRWGYSFSNFIPVPENFNAERSNFGRWDSWDLTLNQLYQWYLDNPHISDQTNDCALEKLFTKNKENAVLHCKEWLKTFSSWTNFVKKTYMQAFLMPDGSPKRFFKNHTLDYGLPKTLDEYEEFFKNASECIRKRGAEMNYYLEMNDLICII